jgi:hypothetical protein
MRCRKTITITYRMTKLATLSPVLCKLGQCRVPHQTSRIMLCAICVGAVQNRLPERRIPSVFGGCFLLVLCYHEQAKEKKRELGEEVQWGLERGIEHCEGSSKYLS